MFTARSCLKTALAVLALTLATGAAPALAQTTQPYTVSLSLQSVSPNPAPVNTPIHIVPIVQPEGDTGGTNPTGQVQIGIYSGAEGSIFETECFVALDNLAAGCDVSLGRPDKYEVMLHYPGDANFQQAYSSKTKLHVFDGPSPPPGGPGGGYQPPTGLPALGDLAGLLLGLLLGLVGITALRRSS